MLAHTFIHIIICAPTSRLTQFPAVLSLPCILGASGVKVFFSIVMRNVRDSRFWYTPVYPEKEKNNFEWPLRDAPVRFSKILEVNSRFVLRLHTNVLGQYSGLSFSTSRVMPHANPCSYVLLARHNPPSHRWLSLTIVLGTQFNEGKEMRRKTHIYHYQPSHWEPGMGRWWRPHASSRHLKLQDSKNAESWTPPVRREGAQTARAS